MSTIGAAGGAAAAENVGSVRPDAVAVTSTDMVVHAGSSNAALPTPGVAAAAPAPYEVLMRRLQCLRGKWFICEVRRATSQVRAGIHLNKQRIRFPHQRIVNKPTCCLFIFPHL